MRSREITVAAVGDLLLDAALSEGGPAASALGDLDVLRQSDVAFANLEGPLTRRGSPARKPVLLRGDPSYAQPLADAGLGLVSLANNHVLDYGPDGLMDTLAALESSGIASCGAGANLEAALRCARVEREGVRMAFLALATTLPPGFAATASGPGVAPVRVGTRFEIAPEVLEEQPGSPPVVRTQVDPADQARVLALIAAEKAESDLVFVSVHWGVPNGDALCEFQRPFAHALIDAGADAILGHHPHVLHGVECYRGRPILYSLGHFVAHPRALGETDWSRPSVPPSWLLTTCARLTLADRAVRSLELLPFCLDVRGNPRAVRGRVADLMIERVAALSGRLGTDVHEREGVAVVNLSSGAPDVHAEET